MPELVVVGPLGEPDLRDERRPHPMRALVGLRPARERALGGFDRPQQAHYAGELAVVEARAGVTDVDETGERRGRRARRGTSGRGTSAVSACSAFHVVFVV